VEGALVVQTVWLAMLAVVFAAAITNVLPLLVLPHARPQVVFRQYVLILATSTKTAVFVPVPTTRATIVVGVLPLLQVPLGNVKLVVQQTRHASPQRFGPSQLVLVKHCPTVTNVLTQPLLRYVVGAMELSVEVKDRVYRPLLMDLDPYQALAQNLTLTQKLVVAIYTVRLPDPQFTDSVMHVLALVDLALTMIMTLIVTSVITVPYLCVTIRKPKQTVPGTRLNLTVIVAV